MGVIMKNMLRVIFSIGLIISIVVTVGCDDSDDKDQKSSYRFFNDSSRSVILYYSFRYTPHVTPQARLINPRESFSVTIDENSTIYWDYDPENRVTAHQVSYNYVVFTDRASSSSGNSSSGDSSGGGVVAPVTPAQF